MPCVYIPPLIRRLTDGTETVEVEADSVREAIARLEELYPGVAERLCQDGEMKPGISVAVNGNVCSRGVLQKLTADDEVHFLPAIGGG